MQSEPRCKKCRRLNQKLFLKGDRCFSTKCAMLKRAYIPGAHGKAYRARLSEYGQQLAAKQKVKFSYGVSEKQFKNYFKAVSGQKGNKEILFVQMLETRLDNVVFRLGWASSRDKARQIVNHGHIMINGRRVDIPSYSVKKDDLISFSERSRKLPFFQNIRTMIKKQKAPDWLASDTQKMEGKVKSMPQIERISDIGEMNKVIEYYSR